MKPVCVTIKNPSDAADLIIAGLGTRQERRLLLDAMRRAGSYWHVMRALEHANTIEGGVKSVLGVGPQWLTAWAYQFVSDARADTILCFGLLRLLEHHSQRAARERVVSKILRWPIREWLYNERYAKFWRDTYLFPEEFALLAGVVIRSKTQDAAVALLALPLPRDLGYFPESELKALEKLAHT